MCKCGSEAFANSFQLRSGKKTSCGCNQYKKGENVYNYTGYKEITGAKWYVLIDGAKKRNIEVDLSKEQVWDIYESQNRNCALTGMPISFKDRTASIDRIDSKKGYTASNIQIVHKDVNLMKNKFDMEYFIAMYKKVSILFPEEN